MPGPPSRIVRHFEACNSRLRWQSEITKAKAAQRGAYWRMSVEIWTGAGMEAKGCSQFARSLPPFAQLRIVPTSEYSNP